MTTHHLPLPRLWSRMFRLFATCALTLACLVFARAAEEAAKAFDIPAGAAVDTLKQAAQQAGKEIMFPAETVRGVQTAAVKGEFTPLAAFNRMLAGTSLVVVQDQKTGAFAVSRVSDPNVSRAAPVKVSDRPGNETGQAEAPVVLDDFAVTGTRIRSLVGEQQMTPTFTMDRQQIERTGATRLGDVFRYIPAITSASNGLSPEAGNGNGTGGVLASQIGVSASLRGFDAAATLILVDGRRVNKMGQAAAGSRYDVIGVPLAAIERIEVLLDGASAIYGADAVAGVINIITRKDYRGTEVRLGYANTFGTDAAKRSVSLTHGFASGKLSGQVSISYEDNTQLANRDVWFQRTGDRRSFGGSDLRSTTLTEGTGYVRTTSGANLPGLTTSRAAIPANSDGRNVTVADYANAGPIGAPFDAISYYVDSLYEMKNGSANFQYRFRPWLTAFLEARASRNTYIGGTTPSFYYLSGLTVPAGYPGNPFGVPVVAVKVFFDESPVSKLIRNETVVTTGVRGVLPRDWRYEASLSVQRANADQLYGNNNISGTAAVAAVNGANPPVLLYDSTRRSSPNAPGTFAPLVATSVGSSRELPVSWLYEAIADGPLWQLPAGPVRLAAGAERREEYVDFVTLAATSTLSGPTLTGANRTSSSVFAEGRVPLVSPQQDWRWLRSVEVAAAGRYDSYADEGHSTNPSLHAMVQPFNGLVLRVDYSQGFKVADIASKYRPATSLTLNSTSPLRIDPLRGNQLVPAPYTQISVGNPDLVPEESESLRYGLVFDIPAIKGLSLSAGWWGTDYTDRIVGVTTAYTFAEAVLALPQLFTRGPNLPGDQAGWPGPITKAAISTNINIGLSRLEGWDASAKYNRDTSWGSFTLRADLAKTTKNELRPRPSAAPSTSVNTDSLPLQAAGSLFWNQGALDTGVLYTYRGSTKFTLGGTSTPSAERWDWQGSYNFDQAGWLRTRAPGWLKSSCAGTRISFTIFNVLNDDPPRDQQGTFDLNVIGARLRHYSLTLTKAF